LWGEALLSQVPSQHNSIFYCQTKALPYMHIANVSGHPWLVGGFEKLQ